MNPAPPVTRIRWAATAKSLDALDDPDELVDPVALLPREANQLPGALGHGAPLRRRRDRDPASAAELEQALVAELPERAEDRVRIDAEHRGEVARRRDALARLRLAV